MKSWRTTLIVGGAVLALVGCGEASSASAPQTSGFGRGNFASGELASINGSTLTVSAQSGDVKVITASSTTVSKQETGGAADIVVGQCAVAVGQKDSTGTVNAVSVTVSSPVG